MGVSEVMLAHLVKVLAQTSSTGLALNTLGRRYKIPVGSTYNCGVSVVIGIDRRDPNVTYHILSIQTTMLHHLSDPNNESVYHVGDMRTDIALLMNPNWYATLHSSVNEVIDVPELTFPVRIGNVIEYTVTAQLSIVP